MRIRTIKPEFWSDEKTGKLSMQAALLFLAMLNCADDKGRLRGSPALLKAQAFPYRPEIDIEAALAELLSVRLVRPYKSGGQTYLEVINFLKHQVINKPSKKTLMPEPESFETIEENTHYGSTTGALREYSGSLPVGLSESSGSTTPRKGREGKGKEGKGKDQSIVDEKPSTVAKDENQNTSPIKELTSRLTAAFSEVRKEAYLHGGAKDAVALKRLLSFDAAEVERRWRRGLSEADRWLNISTFAQLAQKWNELGSKAQGVVSIPAQKTKRPDLPKPITMEEFREKIKDQKPYEWNPPTKKKDDEAEDFGLLSEATE
jgi:hypothetical protein